MKIKYKVPLFISPILIIALTYFGNIWFNLTKDNFDSHLKSELNTLTLKKTNQISSILERVESDIAILATNPLLKEMFDIQGVRLHKMREQELFETFVLTFLKKSKVYRSFSFIDKDGNEIIKIFSTPKPYMKVNVKEEEYFIKTISYPEDVILKYFKQDNSGLYYTTTVFSEKHDLIGIALVELDYELLRGVIKEPATEKDADVFLIDSDGNFIIEIFSTGKISENFKVKIRDRISSNDPVILNTQIFFKDECKDKGEEKSKEELYIFATSQVNFFDWQVLGLYRYSEFIEEMLKLRYRTIVISAIVIVLSLVIMFAITFRLVLPLSALTEKVQDLKEGQWDKVGGRFSHDEIGQLTVKFNEMVDSIKEKQTRIQEAYKILKETQDLIIKKEKLAAIGELSAGVAHEINNPLNNILGYLTLLKRNKKFNKDERKQFEIIEEQINRVTRIVEGLLDFSRQRETKKESIDVNEIIRDVVMQIRKDFKCSQEKVSMSLSEEELMSEVDRDQVWRVFYNIIKNACQAIKGEEYVQVISCINSDKHVEVKVKDNGCGISEKDLEKVFVPFFTTRAEQSGTGLGLAIAVGIIEDHNGKIIVESRENEGAEFRVVLPKI